MIHIKMIEKLIVRKIKTRLLRFVANVAFGIKSSIDFLKQYLEERFQSDMTWNNYGEWEIDHIKPLSSFDLTDRDQLLQACHYTNLQPLWAEENARKGDRLC